MQQLLQQLGIDWHLLLSQAVNFFLLLVVLWYFVYKPLLKLMRDRRARIEEGLMKADEADKRLVEIEEIGKGKLKEAETRALSMLRKTETDAKALEAKLMGEIKQREAEELANAQTVLAAQAEEARRQTEAEAVAFVRRAIAKTVELAPEKIDDALIARAVKEAKQSASA
jgi:F-type H+-transporting ATPase subunit b